jgi:hypothetical protein
VYGARVGRRLAAPAGSAQAQRQVEVLVVEVLLSLAPLFVSQNPGIPFWSSPRFIAVLFPIFIWMAVVCERRGWTTNVLVLSAVAMAILTAQYSLGTFVA